MVRRNKIFKESFKFNRYKDGDRLFPYDHVAIPEIDDDGWCELEIPESMRSDSGNYRCIAENPFGTARTVGEVQVSKEARKPFEERLKDQLKVT